MSKSVNLIKLSVGTETIEDLAAWQMTPRAQAPDGLPRHVTRMWPKREAELLNGGSIYWVIKGVIQCRQRINRLDEYIADHSHTRQRQTPLSGLALPQRARRPSRPSRRPRGRRSPAR
jgi:hypothetical protein